MKRKTINGNDVCRYILQIKFNGYRTPLVNLWDIYEPIRTLKEALSYESIIDHTVEKARIIDTTNNQIVKQWK